MFYVRQAYIKQGDSILKLNKTAFAKSHYNTDFILRNTES